MLFAYTLAGFVMVVLLIVMNAKVQRVERKAYKALRERDVMASNQLLHEAADLTRVTTMLMVSLILWVIGIFGLMLNQ